MSMVLPRSIGHNDVIRLDDVDYRVVWHIERTATMYGFWLLPPPSPTGFQPWASCVWFPNNEKIERR